MKRINKKIASNTAIQAYIGFRCGNSKLQIGQKTTFLSTSIAQDGHSFVFIFWLLFVKY